MLAEHSSQSNVDSTSTPSPHLARTVIYNEEQKALSVTIHDDHANSITPIKIPLVSFAPILATSPNFILVNEFTKRRNQLILFDQYLHKFSMRFSCKENPLDALWYDKQQCFLILTSTFVFKFDPISKQWDVIQEIIPIENQAFKSFTLLNNCTLLMIYDQWSGEDLDQWQQKEDGQWTMIQRQSLGLTSNEFLGDLIVNLEENSPKLAITVYNILTEQWRLELRQVDTLECRNRILLSEGNLAHDYRIIPMQNISSDIQLLVFSTGNSDIFAIDNQWKKLRSNYKHSIQRMALFNENWLIIRTNDKIDIHSII